ncbi:MAG: polysaccharide biosynthesis C-terminal domain-containing protein [Candidatus Kapaibacterium sp.]
MYSQIKKLGSETLIYGFATVFGRFLNFLLTPMYSNLLVGPEYEFVIYIYTLLAFVNVLYSFGMESSFFRFYTKDNLQQAKKVFTISFYTINVLSLLFTFIFLFSSDFIAESIAPDLISAPELIKLAVFIPLLDALILVPMGYLRMTNQAKKFAAIRFLMIFLTVILNFALLMGFNLQAKGVLLAQLITSFLAVLYILPIIFRHFLKEFDPKLLSRMLKFGLPTLPASLAAIILQVADRPILAELTDSYKEIVTYQVNYRLGIPMMIFVTVFEYAWKPFYLTNYTQPDARNLFARIFTYFTLIAALIFVLITMFIQHIVMIPGIGGKYFINPEYWSGLHIIPIILIAYYFNGVFTNMSAGILIEKKTAYLPLAVGTAAVVNIALNFILIPIMGYTGAAWATLAAYLVSALIIYYVSYQVYPVNYEWSRILKIIVAAGIIFVSDKFASEHFVGIMSFMIKIILLTAFIMILKFMNFFGKEEIELIRKFIKRR